MNELMYDYVKEQEHEMLLDKYKLGIEQERR
jgi:hypothetical protein